MRSSHQLSLLSYWRSLLEPHWQQIASVRGVAGLTREARLKVKRWWEQELGMDEFHPALERRLVFDKMEQDCIGVIESTKYFEAQKLVKVFRELAHECVFYL